MCVRCFTASHFLTLRVISASSWLPRPRMSIMEETCLFSDQAVGL